MNNSITIRPANITDAKKLSILYKTVYIQTYGTEGVSDEFANFITLQFSVSRLEEIINNNPGNIIVAEYHNNLVGVTEIEQDKKSPVGNIIAAELNKLYILEWCCGKGIGKQLLKAAEQMAISKGAVEMWLWVLESNARAITFYENHHFKLIGNASFQMETNSYDNKVMVKKLIIDNG